MTVWALFALGCGAAPSEGAVPLSVVAWNTGSGGPGTGVGGWNRERSEIGDAWYGNGLAWLPAIADAERFFELAAPHVVVLTEVFDPRSGCADIPEEARAGFVCEGWREGDASVARRVLGESAQIGCFPGHADKCLAVLPPARFEGCVDETCPIVGANVDGCGSGSRVGSARVVVGDDEWTLVGVHGTSGLSVADQACREAWLGEAFEAAGDGRAMVLGDFNTDPVRFLAHDSSATRLVELAEGWTWLSDLDGPATYQGIATIDHALGRGFVGSCDVPGLTVAAASGLPTFDHKPLWCQASASALSVE